MGKGAWISLTAADQADYPVFFHWRCSHDINLLNFGRRVASYEEFVGELERLIQSSVLFIVRDNQLGVPIGFLCGYNHNPWDGWMWVGAYIEAPFRYRGHGGEASLLGLDFLFRQFPLRMVYTEIYEFARPLLKLSQTVGFEEVGFQPNHYWHEDRFWGIHRLALTRDRWDERKERFQDILHVQEEMERRRGVAVNGGE
jgi:RimJ/RimL family protein N-acetyltransferase